jgi:hypothetical protein
MILVGLGATRIVLTYHVFSQTYDEPASIAAGMEWLDRGSYRFDFSNPPLARLAIAIGLYLDGLRLPARGNELLNRREDQIPASEDWALVGNQILHEGDQYTHNLTLARMGVLPFFLLSAVAVWVWSRSILDDASALLAVFLFTTLPPVLAHAGLATTDMALCATFVVALSAFSYWLERPTYLRSSILGVAVALAVLSKFTALLFLPAGGLAMLGCRWRTDQHEIRARAGPFPPRGRAVLLVVMTGLFVLWGGYRFTVRTVTRAAYRPHEKIDLSVGTEGPLHRLAYLIAERVPVPAPEFLLGIQFQRMHAASGHLEYLLGEVSKTGWWYFFPLILAVKSPLPFVILSGVGLVVLGLKAYHDADWYAFQPAAIALALLLVSMPSRINLGVRLILPIYPALAMVAGFGVVSLWNAAGPRWIGPVVVAALLLWQLETSVRAHPDYLAYFNELARGSPERIAVDSDLDWGQDLLRLAAALRTRKIDSVAIGYFGSAEVSRHHLPQLRPLLPYQPTAGWIAISKSRLKYGEEKPPYRGYAWLESRTPVALIGESMLLYYVDRSKRDRYAPD